MGIIIHEYEITYNGVVLSNVYVSTANGEITIRKEGNEYVYSCSFSVFCNKECRDLNKSIVSRENITYKTQNPVTDNVYSVLYNELKFKFPNCNDE